MYLAINIIGLIVFLAIGWLFSKDRKAINWRAVLTMTALNLVMAWFLTSFPIGRTIVKGAAAGFGNSEHGQREVDGLFRQRAAADFNDRAAV